MILVIIANEEMNDIIEIVKYLGDASLLIRSVNETNENETKEQKVRFLLMLLDTLGSSSLGNLLTGKR